MAQITNSTSLFQRIMSSIEANMSCVVIVISEFLERQSKAKRTRAPPYARALRWIKGFPKL